MTQKEPWYPQKPALVADLMIHLKILISLISAFFGASPHRKDGVSNRSLSMVL